MEAFSIGTIPTEWPAREHETADMLRQVAREAQNLTGQGNQLLHLQIVHRQPSLRDRVTTNLAAVPPIGNYVDRLDLSDLDAAMKRIAPGTRVRVEFAAEREGRITDFSFYCLD